MNHAKPGLRIAKLVPALILIIGLILFFALGGYRYFSFAMLKAHHDALAAWTLTHPVLATCLFMIIYIVSVAFSFPGATLLTLSAGFLFGFGWGTIVVVVSATLGGTIVFLVARYAFGEYLSHKAGSWLSKLEQGFQRDAVSYLLFLRLLPIFPFWLINIVPGLLNIRLSVFFFTTLIGIIPGSAVYVAVGSGLSSVFARDESPNLGVIFEPQIMIPIIILAILSVLPIAYRRWKTRKGGVDE